MRVLEWALESQKTVRGKIISVVLSVALIFSFSNFFYGDNAFAEEQEVEKTTEVTTETEKTEPVVTEVENESDKPQTETQEQKSTETTTVEDTATSEDQISAQAEGDTSDPSNNGNDETPEFSVVFDENSCTLTISGKVDVTSAMVQQYKGKVKIVDIDINGNIEKGSFSYCGQLEEVIVKNAKTIGEGAFRFSNNLKKLSLNNVDVVGKSVAHGNKNLTELTLQNIGTIDEEAFQWCVGLTSIDLSGVNKLERSAFTYCNGLTEVTLANIELGTNPFYQCENLASVTLDNATFTGVNTFDGCASLKNVTLKNMDTVGNNMFINCANLEKVSISNVKNISTSLFSGKANLKEVSITGENVTIGESAFLRCSALSKVELKGVTAIDSYAFQYCKSLESIELDGVSTIRDYAFSKTGLKNATLTNIGTVGSYSFWDNGSLETVTMSDIDSIANYAFWNCSNLKAIDSLSNVTTSIGGFAFYGCSSLTGLTVADLTKMGYIGSNDEIMKRVQAILAGTFKLEDASEIVAIEGEEGWEDTTENRDAMWNTYDNRTQVIQQARWVNDENTEAQVKVDAYFTAEKQMDYVFVADLSGSMALIGNSEDSNARFYDMQSKLLDMVSQLMGSDGYDCHVTIITFGGYVNDNNPGAVNSASFESADEAISYIKSLEPLNENTDYKLGLNEALAKVQSNQDRNTSVIFLSDGRPTRDGKNELKTVTQCNKYNSEIAGIAQQIRNTGAEMYGVLHSPSEEVWSAKAMEAVCKSGEENNYWISTDTQSFSDAMNMAFTATYPTYTLTIPVGDDFENANIVSLSASAGEAVYNAENNCVVWKLSGMPFTKHTLVFNETLKQSSIDRDGYGTHDYLNNGAGPDLDGATIALNGSVLNKIQSTVLSREVLAPVIPDDPTPEPTPTPDPTPTPNPGDGAATNPGTDATTTPTAPTGVGPVVPAGTPAATPADDAGVVIPDEENPLAAQPGVEIADDENPLAAFDTPQCWVHYLMIIGIILTVIYGAAVVARRLGYARKIDKIDKNMTGIERTSERADRTHGVAHHA